MHPSSTLHRFGLVAKVMFAISIGMISFLTLAAIAGIIDPAMGMGTGAVPALMENSEAAVPPKAFLAYAALRKVLNDGAPIFGHYENVQSATSTWMKQYDDAIPITQMNIPGTHDTATWNYSQQTQQRLNPITQLVNPGLEVNSSFFRCNQRPIINMLDDGIRAFDMRYALDVTNSTIVFWHGPALQSETATLEDVLFGFYHWLEDHPSETVLLSFQLENNLEMGNSDSPELQMQLFTAFTNYAAKKYFLQRQNSFGTLGEARGKIILLRRFDLDLLPAADSQTIPGVHFSPSQWTDNSANITLIYNEQDNGTAYIEDYYQPMTALGSTAEKNIEVKYNATVAHLNFAAKAPQDALIWSFASSTNIFNSPPNTPRDQALGEGSVSGVNQRLAEFLPTMKGKRLGILMLDFYEEPADLVQIYLSLLNPKA